MSDARDIIEQLLRRSRGPRGPNGPRTITPSPPNISWKAVIAGIVALIVLWTAASSLYQVQPDERGVITRFGRVIGIAENGLNFKLPFGIDAVQVVPTQRVQKEEFGFRSEKADRARTQFAAGNPDESLNALEKAVDKGYGQKDWVEHDTDLDSLREIPRFKRIIEGM